MRLEPPHSERERPGIPVTVLYVGGPAGTNSFCRAQALERLGHRVRVLDPQAGISRGRITDAINHRTGFRLSRRIIATRISRAVSADTYDVAWVDDAAAVSRSLVRALHRVAPVVLSHSSEDVFGVRDGHRWDTYRAAIPEYDLVVVVRDHNVDETLNAGARAVHRVWRCYDEVAHAPVSLSVDDRHKWGSRVVFVGQWMPERGPFLVDLLQRGVALAIYGPRWHRAPEWPVLREFVRGGYLRGADYARAIQSASVCLGLVSVGSRDLSTTRSVEIPALGGLLCAERTSEHSALYEDRVEALLWSSADECAALCSKMLAEPKLAAAIARRGQARVRSLRLGNEDLAHEILRVAGVGNLPEAS